jgi:hypothetical protein
VLPAIVCPIRPDGLVPARNCGYGESVRLAAAIERIASPPTRPTSTAFRELAPQVRNTGGKVFGGKVQWIRPRSDSVFTGVDAEPDFAVNAFFPVAHGYKARNEGVGYTLKLAVWDEGEQRRVIISSQASRQGDRPQASGARRKLLRMLTEADDTLTVNGAEDGN